MKKAILYRFCGLGAVPKRVLPVLEQEGIFVLDEGMSEWFIINHVNGPGKRYRHRSEGFSGCLAVTKERGVCYTYLKRQISISIKDPKVTQLYEEVPKEHRLSVSFSVISVSGGLGNRDRVPVRHRKGSTVS